jgi:hypothetical protein
LETFAGDFFIREKSWTSTTAMNALEAAPIVSFENRLVKPIAESHRDAERALGQKRQGH